MMHNMKPPLFRLLLVLGAFLPVAAEDPPPLPEFRESLRKREEAHRERVRSLVDLYRQHLERLVGEVQAEGDLETLLRVREEMERVVKRPYETVDDMPERLTDLRDIFDLQLRELTMEHRRERRKVYEAFVPLLAAVVRDLTREGELERASVLAEHLKKAEKVLAELRPEPAEGQNQPDAPAPGRDLLAGAGSFDEEEGWHINKPHGNDSRIFQVPHSGKNKVLRVEFVGHRGIHIRRQVPLREGRRYRIQWRARMYRPWDEEVGLRRRPPMMIELRVHPNVWVNLPAGDREGLAEKSLAPVPLPPGEEWVEGHVDLAAGKHMDQLNIRSPAGDQILFLDDIEIRELPEPPADIKP